jgi:glyoxylase-like metal-dependent hydrolase (beta-lactamase superfamily II)
MVNDRSRVARVLAPNPSPMTLEGTNSYLVFGDREAIAIDPGPAHAGHVDALVAAAAARGAAIAAIAVTHGHPDHAPGAALLAAKSGAPVYAHPHARFPHDRTAFEGDRIAIAGAALAVVDAPGHADDHLVFAFDDEAALFTGDVVIGRGTVVIAPPHGDMRAYEATLRRLRAHYPDARAILGGHGDAVADPAAKLDEYLAHRRERERQVLVALGDGERTIPEIVADLYRSVPSLLWPAAARQVLAHLIALEREGRVARRVLERDPTDAERALLDPDLSQIADAETAAVARAELGFERGRARLEAYARR